MTKLYLIRHAEAEGNLYRRIHGQYNSLITNNGYRQIKALEKRFQDIPIDAVYSSDLFRTMTTARAIYVPKGLALHTRPDLREINMGDWEDRSFADVDRTDHEMMALFSASSPDYRAPNGESFPEIRRRGVKAILDIAAQPDRGGLCPRHPHPQHPGRVYRGGLSRDVQDEAQRQHRRGPAGDRKGQGDGGLR